MPATLPDGFVLDQLPEGFVLDPVDTQVSPDAIRSVLPMQDPTGLLTEKDLARKQASIEIGQRLGVPFERIDGPDYSAYAQAAGFQGDPSDDNGRIVKAGDELGEMRKQALDSIPDKPERISEVLSNDWKRGLIGASVNSTLSGLNLLMPEIDRRQKELDKLEEDISRMRKAGVVRVTKEQRKEGIGRGGQGGYLDYLMVNAEKQRELLASMREIANREAARIVEMEIERASIEVSKALKEYSEAEGFGGRLVAAAKNPSAIASVIVESTSSQLPTLIQSTAGGMIGGPIVGSSLVFKNSLETEHASYMLDEMARRGVDIGNAESVMAMLNDQKALSEISAKAFRKAIPVAMFDALSGGKLPVKGKVASVAAEVGMQATADASGELLGQAWADGSVDGAAVFDEMIAGISQNVAETGVKVAGGKIVKSVPAGESLPDGFEASPLGKTLEDGKFSEETFTSIAKAVSKEEFAGQFGESEDVKAMAEAAYDGSRDAQMALGTLYERTKAQMAEDAAKAAQADLKADKPPPDWMITEAERIAREEFDKLDPARFDEEFVALMTPEQEAELMRIGKEAEANAALVESVDFDSELLKVVKDLGGLASADESLQGEIDRIRGNLKENKLVRGVFKKDAKQLDQLRRSLEEHGFFFETPADMLSAIDEAASGWEVYPMYGGGTYSRPRPAKKGNLKMSKEERFRIEKQRIRDMAKAKQEEMKAKFAERIAKEREKAVSKVYDQKISAAKKMQAEIEKRIAAIRELRKQRKDITRSIKTLEKMVKLLPVSVRGKFTGFGKVAEKVTIEAQGRQLDEAVEKIAGIFDSYILRESKKRLSSLLDRYSARSSADAKRIDLLVSPDVRERIQLADKAANMSRDEARMAAGEIMDKEGGISSEEDLISYGIYSIFGGALSSGDSKLAMGAYRALTRMIVDGRTDAQEFLAKRAERVESLKNGTVKAILGSEQPKSVNRINFEMESRGWAKSVADAVNTFAFTRLDGFETFMDNLSSEPGRYQGFLHDEFTKRVFDANTEEHTKNRHDLERLRDSVARALGLPPRPTGKQLRTILHKLKSWQEIKESTGIVYESQGRVEEQPMSEWQAMSLWMQWQDKSLASTFAKMKIDESVIGKVEEFIGPDGVSVARSMLRGYETIGKQIQSKVEAVDGYRPMLVENYSPVRRRMVDVDELSQAATSQDYVKATEKNGSLKSRIRTTSELVFEPADRVYVRHVNLMNHYMAWAEVARDMNTVLRSDQVKTAVLQKSGSKNAYPVLSRLMDDMLRGAIDRTKFDSTAAKIISNLAVSKLALNATSAVKQLASFPAYADMMPAKEFAKGIADFWKSPIANSKTLIATDYIQNRIRQSYDRDLRQVAEKGTALAISDIRNYKDRMMFLTRYGDLGAILQGGWAVYRHAYNQAIEAGSGHEAASRAAEKAFSMVTDRSQQSAQIMSLSDWQRAGSFAKLFTMYMTSPIQYLRITANAVKAWKGGRISGPEMAKTVFIYHFLLPQVFTAMGSAFIGLWSDDDDVEDAFWKRQMTAALVGNFNAIFLFGDGIEAILQSFVNEDTPGFLLDQKLPLHDEISSVAEGADDIFNNDVLDDQWIKGADKLASGILSLSGIPYDPVKKQIDGILDAAQGETDHPLLRFLGFSEYALGEDTRKSSGSRSADTNLNRLKGKE